jgi:hypothetical protein
VFVDEQPRLLSLPAIVYLTEEVVVAKVGKTPHVRFCGNDYSVRRRWCSGVSRSGRRSGTGVCSSTASGLVDHRPWRAGVREGVWQLLPPPARCGPDRALRELSAADVLQSFGFEPR